MRQTFAAALDGAGRSRKFGHVGARARLFATGIGTLLDPATSNSALEMAGNWTIG
jgi:predicted PhzF superfamily epimerase YddE/YHI9